MCLEAWVAGLIELSKFEWLLGAGHCWKPGTPLKLLFAGYNGTRNTGSDVRVEEMLRQVRKVLGQKNLDVSVLTQNFELTRGYFGDARQIFLPDVFPPMLHTEVPKNDGVIACEGSMFKSKFSNALTTMFIGALGIASAQNKLSMGYGAEAGSHGSQLAANVPALLPRLDGDHAEYRIAGCSWEAWNSQRTWDRHGVDFRTAGAGIWAQSVVRCRLGWSDARAGGVSHQSILVAG